MQNKYCYEVFVDNYTFDPETARIDISRQKVANIPHKISLDNMSTAMTACGLLMSLACILALFSGPVASAHLLIAHILTATLFIIFSSAFIIATFLYLNELHYIRDRKAEILEDEALQAVIAQNKKTAELDRVAWIEHNYEVYLIMKAYPQFETVKEARDFYELGVMKKHEN